VSVFSEVICLVAMPVIENLYSPSKHGRQQTISSTNEIKQSQTKNTRSSLQI